MFREFKRERERMYLRSLKTRINQNYVTKNQTCLRTLLSEIGSVVNLKKLIGTLKPIVILYKIMGPFWPKNLK